MQPQTDRSFSRSQHRSGRWRTTSFRRYVAPLRWLLRCISFKYQELDRIARQCLPHELIMDLGAGVGAYAGYVLHRCPAALITVDWSPEALRRIPAPPVGRLLKVCADARRLPFKASCIDILYSIDTLGHIREQETALDEINRICRSGAPLFLHSECADYRRRWPDRVLIRKCGTDHIAEMDGHFGIRSSDEMRRLYERRFSISRFYSPAGLLGWLTGYPEKYLPLFCRYRMLLPVLPAALFTGIRALPGCRTILRLCNTLTNRGELSLGLQGGGSCFAQARTVQTMSPDRPAIDVVLPTYNRPAVAGNVIPSLAKQLGTHDRLLVVWQGNQPPEIPSGNNRVMLIHRLRANLPAARNCVLHRSGNPIILYIDDDCTIQEGLLDAHRNAYRDHHTGAVAGFVDDPLSPSDAAVPSRFDPTTGALLQHFALPESGPSLSVMGANMSFRRSALEKINGFDAGFRRNALWEEIDVSFRLQRAGYRIHYRADARVTHARHHSGGCRQDATARYIYHQFANTAYFACRYMPLKYIRSWTRYWKYRLEFLSRSQSSGTKTVKIRHRPHIVIAGVTGAFAGTLRFFFRSRRIGLPAEVITAHVHEKEVQHS